MMASEPHSLKILYASVILLSLLFEVGSSRASEELDAKKFQADQFEGWSGIVFSCERNPPTGWLEAVCEAAKQEARLLAATSSIPFVSCDLCIGADTADDAFRRYRLPSKAGIEHPLPLYVTILATKGGSGSLVGVHVTVKAEPFYTDAVESDAASSEPEGQPKSGSFSLWDRDFIASGTVGSDLTNSVIRNIETLLKDFFATFVEARARSN